MDRSPTAFLSPVVSPPTGPHPAVRERLKITQAQALFSHDVVYLDTASAGLPPGSAVVAMEHALGEWRSGRATPQAYDAYVEEARAIAARLLRVDPGDLAIGSQTSVFAGLVAASLPAGSTVVIADCEFTSLLFPFLAQEERGVRVRQVRLPALAEAIDADTSLVAVSAVQSCDGGMADLAAIRAAARTHGARVFVDATQSAGWLPLDARQFDYVACSAYKWLLCPRGVAFMSVRPERRGDLLPANAGWYAGEDVWTSIYGPPLRLAQSARRFDVSPAWLSWTGAVPALRLLEQVGPDAIYAHNVGLANRFRHGLGMAPGDSAIVSVTSVPDAPERIARAGVRASVRAGGLRAAFHLYNTVEDVDRALDALTR